MRHFLRPAGIVLAFGFVVFLGLYLVHRIGEGDSYSLSASGGTTDIYGPAVSPLTGNVVYASLRTGRGDLYLSDENGDHTRRLTRDPRCENCPVFSPDGNQIAYIKETPQAATINCFKGEAWIMNADGTHAHAVTHDETNYTEPTFSADSKTLYLIRLTPSAKVYLTQLFRVDVNGTYDPVLVPGDSERYAAPLPKPDARTPNASPDGKWQVFASDPYNQSLSLSHGKPSQARQIFQSKQRNYLTHPRFSKNGKTIFFHEEGMNGPLALSKVGIDGSGYRQIAPTHR